MTTTLRLKDVHVGFGAQWLAQRTGAGHRPWEYRAIVIGDAFGPRLLVAGGDLEEAFDEWDERDKARHVDMSDPSLLDYRDNETAKRAMAEGAELLAACIEAAMAHGDIRINDGGTMAWADPYEWVRTFRTVREAGAFFRNS